MNLDFSNDQKFLQEEARKFLEKENSINRNRGVLDSDHNTDAELWNKIVDLGWTGIRIPEEYGGLGLTHLELCVIAEELGRFLAPVPFSSSVYLFTEAIIKYASEDIKQEILPKLISGEVIGTLAVTEEFCAPTSTNTKTEVNNSLVSGKKVAVPDAGIATHSIIVAKSGDGINLQLVNHSSDKVVISHQENIDESRGHFSITLDNAPCKLIGDTLNGWDLFESLMDQAAVLFSFEQLGGYLASDIDN